MKIYLDQDVPIEVKALVDHLGEVKTAFQKGWTELKDPDAYAQAVRAGFDLIITCNKSENNARKDQGFEAEVTKSLKCQSENLPVHIHNLWEKGDGNNWHKLKQKWPDHLEKIEAVALALGEKHEVRRAEAVKQLEQLQSSRPAERLMAGNFEPLPVPRPVKRFNA